jgi:hypothetical protein
MIRLYPIDAGDDGTVWGLARGGTYARWPRHSVQRPGFLEDLIGRRATFPTKKLAREAARQPSKFEWWKE